MRRKRKIDRQAGKLADTNLIVIASEDRYAVKQYFGLFHSAKIQFEVLETEDGASSPVDVLARLDMYRKEFQIGDALVFSLARSIRPITLSPMAACQRVCSIRIRLANHEVLFG